MPRHALRRGEATPTRLDVREPGGKWVALSSMPSGYRAPRGTTWRARARIRIGASAQPVRVSAEGETRVAAERLLGQRLDQYRRDDGRTTATTDTVGERVAAYMEDVEAGDVPAVRAERSRTTYRSIAKNHVTGGKIAGVRVTELTPADLNREAQRLHKKGATSQLRHWRALLNAAVQRAVDDGTLDRNPVRDMAALPKPAKKHERVYKNNSVRTRNDILTDNQVDRLLRTAYGDPGARSSGLADLLSLNASIGLRLGEAVSIRWQDLDLDAEVPTLSVVGKLVRKKSVGLVWEDFVKSGMSNRTIPLPADTVEMLRARSRIVAERKLSGEATEAETKFVFPSSTRSTPDPDNVNKRVRKVFDAAELPTATNHILRRTVEDRLKRSGVNDIDIERVMGHTQAVAHASYWDRSSVPTGALDGLEGYSAPKGEPVTKLRSKRYGDLRAANR